MYSYIMYTPYVQFSDYFSIFTKLCDHYSHLIPGHFHQARKEPLNEEHRLRFLLTLVSFVSKLFIWLLNALASMKKTHYKEDENIPPTFPHIFSRT